MVAATAAATTDKAALVVIDTNIVLDLFIFSDPRCTALKLALQNQQLRWVSTQVMRDELERVLAYTHLQPRMAFYAVTAAQVLAQFDAHAHITATAPRAMYVCKDEDDQKFIDLAAAHSAVLLSKDKAVLSMRKRLAQLGVAVSSQWMGEPSQALQS
jgi:putative PIN family toxin of toxin-antitoxin system